MRWYSELQEALAVVSDPSSVIDTVELRSRHELVAMTEWFNTKPSSSFVGADLTTAAFWGIPIVMSDDVPAGHMRFTTKDGSVKDILLR